MKKNKKDKSYLNRLRILLVSKRARRKAKTYKREIFNKFRWNQTVVEAPVQLDLYGSKNARETMSYIYKIKKICLDDRGTVRLSFNFTTKATAAAVLLLFGTLDSIILKRKNRCVRMVYPKVEKIEQILQHVGIVGLLGKTERLGTADFDDDVGYWKSTSGTVFQSESIGEFLQVSLGDAVSTISRSRRTYTMLQETIANSLEHAYIDKVGDPLEPEPYHKYWAFAGISKGAASLLVLDLGVGIPMSIRAVHSKSVIEKAAAFLRIDRLTTDYQYIQLATAINKSRKQSDQGRGHGLSGLTRPEILDNGSFHIYSNKGAYSFNGAKSGGESLRNSVNGTLIEFTFKLTPEERPRESR